MLMQIRSKQHIIVFKSSTTNCHQCQLISFYAFFPHPHYDVDLKKNSVFFFSSSLSLSVSLPCSNRMFVIVRLRPFVAWFSILVSIVRCVFGLTRMKTKSRNMCVWWKFNWQMFCHASIDAFWCKQNWIVSKMCHFFFLFCFTLLMF